MIGASASSVFSTQIFLIQFGFHYFVEKGSFRALYSQIHAKLLPGENDSNIVSHLLETLGKLESHAN